MAYTFAGHRFSVRRKRTPRKYDLGCDPEDFQFLRTRGRPWDLPAPEKCYGFPDQARAYFQNAGFLSDLQLAFEQLFGRIYYLGPLREYPRREYQWAGEQPVDVGQRGERAVEALLASRDRGQTVSRGRGVKRKTVEEMVAYWMQEMRLVHRFRVEPITRTSNLYRVWVTKDTGGAEVLITDVGFGVSQVLPILVLCYYVPKQSTIILEHPEIHLHPTAQAALADVFLDAVKTRSVQIILESHSEHLLRRLQRRIAEKELDAEEAAFYFCGMDAGETIVTPLKLDMFGNITNWPKDFFGDSFGETAAMSRAIGRRHGGRGV